MLPRAERVGSHTKAIPWLAARAQPLCPRRRQRTLSIIAGRGQETRTGPAPSLHNRIFCDTYQLAEGRLLRSGGGDIYNEFPDRLADAILIVAVGYVALGAPWPHGDALGWAACCLAVLTAYVRAMGASIGARHAFHGPMAKPHRMFLLTCACIAAAAVSTQVMGAQIMYAALCVMVLGAVVTPVRRLRAIAGDLRRAA